MSRDLQLVRISLKIDPSKMAWSFSRSSPVQNNGSKTWTGELLDTLQVSWYQTSQTFWIFITPPPQEVLVAHTPCADPVLKYSGWNANG